MTVTDQLRQIAALVEAVAPLGNKQRGMRIEADEWNRLVGTLLAILEIDRLQETNTRLLLTEQVAPKEHEHLGQVEVTWLGPTMQERLGEGTGALSTRAALSDIGKRVDTAAVEVARLTGLVERQQQRNDRAAVDELERGAKLREFETRFAGLEDLRALVSSLAGNVSGLGPAIQTVLDLRAELRDPAGNPIDVSGLVAGLAEVRTLAEHLNGINGEPVRLRDVELRLTDLEMVTGLPGGTGLEGRLATLRADIESGVDARIAAAVAQLRAELDARVGAAGAELREEFDTRVATSAEQLREEFDARVDERVPELIEQRFRDLDLPGQLQEIADRLKQELFDAMESELSGIRKQLESHTAQLKQLDERVRRLEG